MKATILIICVAFCSAVWGVQKDELAESIARGKTIYNDYCVSCHLDNGEGIEGSFPPLAKADFLTKFPEQAIYAVKFGMEGKIVVNGKEYDNMMPNPGLDPAQVADVMNYIRNSWGNNSGKKMVTVKMVEAVKEKK